MRYLHTIIIVLFFVLSIFFSLWVKQTFADRYISQINVESSSEKIKKLQEVFKWLELYNWPIDWDFYSIRESLINYQVENWIVPSADSEEAGYFWNKTIKSLKQKYWKDFIDLQENYLKLEQPQVNQEWHFIVTAYYSPLPWQEKYLTWSYESEMKLNGWWNTASWKKPSTWTIAAPRNYPFWTKIYLEWYWIWTVEDRWWAIVNAWDKWFLHDRLDIWLWYGDEWRKKTQEWWKKTVKWYIVDPNTESKVSFDFKEKKEEIISEEKKEDKKEKTFDLIKVESKNNEKIEEETKINYYNLTVNPENSITKDVKQVQSLFSKLNLYDWEIDWKYSSIKNFIIDYQIKNWIIKSRYSEEAGFFGKKTVDSLKANFWENFDKIPEKIKNSLSDNEKKKVLQVIDKYKENLKQKNFSDNQKIKNEISLAKQKIWIIIEKFSWKEKEILIFLVENL